MGIEFDVEERPRDVTGKIMTHCLPNKPEIVARLAPAVRESTTFSMPADGSQGVHA
jgi:hypothetical protein